MESRDDLSSSFMFTSLAAVIAPLVVFLLIVGCAPERVHPDEPRTRAVEEDPRIERRAELRADLPPISTRTYEGPEAEITIHPVGEIPERGRTIEVRMTVPSGGHRLMLDHGDVIEGEAVVFLTLIRPAPGEMVTMALETLRETFETERRFEHAHVYVRTYRRGEDAPEEYRHAGEKRWE